MAIVQEFAPEVDRVTATFSSPLMTGGSFDSPIALGYYESVCDEIFMSFGGCTTNIQVADIPAFIKQLKRAAKLASEQKGSE